MSQQKGFLAEQKACHYLEKHGLCLVEKNYQTRCGEIDLIMRDESYYVFIEVRARQSNRFGGALASISKHKQQKIIKTAMYYLQKNKLQEKFPIRFDVVSLQGSTNELLWIPNAFDLDC